LKRRLSKTQHTSFIGRVLLFVASIFPISEKSGPPSTIALACLSARTGVNLRSTFNVGNTTTYEAETDIQPEVAKYVNAMLDVPSQALRGSFDYQFYKKLWSLQDYFRDASVCYTEARFEEFVAVSALSQLCQR
jgi:THO complex subunit 1